MSEPFIGEIILFGGNFAPKGWAFCDGSLLSIAQNSALFSILGTTYGGNGQTTFALPDLRGRAPIGFGQGPGLSPYVQGEVTGSETTTILVSNLPAHTHAVVANDAGGESASPNNAFLAQGLSGRTATTDYNPSLTAPVTLNPQTVQPTGGSIPVSNIQPVLVLNYIIALVGIFPSRG